MDKTVPPVTVSIQTISLPLIAAGSTNTPPTPPAIVCDTPGTCAITSPSSATVPANTDFSIKLTASDPDTSDTIRYAVDWDNNTSVDEYLPAVGYVNSNTPQSKLWNLPVGTYPFQAYTEDNNGAISGWTPYTITVVPNPVVNGSCGIANGLTLSSAPTSGLCYAGTSSSVTGSGPWNWTCAGTNGGTTASCSALKAPTDCGAGTATWTAGGNTCSGPYSTITSGNSSTIPSTNGNTGNVTVTCNNGTPVQSNPSCTAPVGAISVNLTATPAGPLTVPGTTNLSWTTTGSPYSCDASNYWSGTDIHNGDAVTQRSGMTPGTYLFDITCHKTGTADATSRATVVVNAAPAATGFITPNSCTIPDGRSSCAMDVVWGSSGTVGTVTVQKPYDSNNIVPGATGPSGTVSATFTPPGTYRLDLYDGATKVDTGADFVASCNSTSHWNGSMCVANAVGGPVNGACSPTHYNCSAGTPSNTGGNASYWTWDCLGSNSGTDALGCSEAKGVTCSALSSTITATPARVHVGSPSHIAWSASGVSTSCIITKNGTTITTILANSCSIPNGGTGTDPTINSQTTFCITCDGNTSAKKCVLVNVSDQNFKEF